MKIVNNRILLIALFLAAIICLSQINFLFPTYDGESDAVAVTTKKNSFLISHESGFYTNAISLEFDGNSISEIYYTLDGSDPAFDNPSAFLYDEGIYMSNEGTESIYTIRSIAYFLDGSSSEIINRTFIIGDNVETRYDVPVLCVSAPDDFFWGEENGRLYSDNRYKMSHRAYEKEIFITLFDSTGNVLLSQNCGHRIHGNLSRMKNQVSFRLRARSEYDSQNDFEYPLFENCLTKDNSLVSEYKRLIVRNSGNDNGYALIRSELASRLSLDSGYKEAPCAIPVSVYLNNTYYGFFWLENGFDETYYKETYGDYEGTMYTFEGQMNYIVCDDETDEVAVSLVNDYYDKIRFFATCDLNQEDNWTQLNEFIDVDNFLYYVAIQHYIANNDSLTNNYKVFRYSAPEGGSYTPGTVFDGRYRFILFDLDFAFGWTTYSSKEDLITTHRLTTPDDCYAFFANLMQREDCRRTYIQRLLSLQNYYFSYDYANKALNEMHTAREAELRQTYTTTDWLINNPHSPDVTSGEDIEAELDKIRDFLANRHRYIYQDLSNCFGPFTTYNLSISNNNNAVIDVDYATFTDATFTGEYYKEVPVRISASAKPGYKFDYWILNGEIINTPEITITQELITTDTMNLVCVSSKDSSAGLLITAIKSNVSNDYIQLSNIGTTDLYLNEYYLSNGNVWNQSPLPMLRLKSGETITVYCKNYTSIDALGQPYANFNIKANETVSLYNKDGSVLQSVLVPNLGTEDGIYQMDPSTGDFFEYIP